MSTQANPEKSSPGEDSMMTPLEIRRRQPWHTKLRVWWIPQVPGKSFEVLVKTPQEAVLLCQTLSDYDNFQFHNQIKPDYTNAGGIQEWEDGEWIDAWDPEDENLFEDWGM